MIEAITIGFAIFVALIVGLYCFLVAKMISPTHREISSRALDRAATEAGYMTTAEYVEKYSETVTP